MFSYYGSKSKIVHLYPKPKHSLIIEPFAGSARYALRYFDRDVILVDKFHKVIAIWNYLKLASERDILSLPDDVKDLREHSQLCDAERWLIGFLLSGGSADSRLSTSQCGGFPMWNYQEKRKISRSLFKIRHWQFVHGTYECLGNPEATWFIDPPYFQGGESYRHKFSDFGVLADWAQSRNGQAIVCENSSADWLPFLYLSKHSGHTKTTEVFWTNEKVEYQADLF